MEQADKDKAVKNAVAKVLQDPSVKFVRRYGTSSEYFNVLGKITDGIMAEAPDPLEDSELYKILKNVDASAYDGLDV